MLTRLILRLECIFTVAILGGAAVVQAAAFAKAFGIIK